MRLCRYFYVLCLVSGVIFLLSVSEGRAETYVTQSGSAAPIADSLINPFMLVESAVLASDNPTVLIQGGVYREAFTIGRSTLMSVNGPVTIGSFSVAASTSIDLITMNTHLYGNLAFGDGTWQDDNRAVDIANLASSLGADIVSFQEIWDEDLFWGGDEQTGILPHSGYVDGFHGDDWDCLGCINSGLATMSLYSISGKVQYFFQIAQKIHATVSTAWLRKGG